MSPLTVLVDVVKRGRSQAETSPMKVKVQVISDRVRVRILDVLLQDQLDKQI